MSEILDMIESKGMTAPHVTPADIDTEIAREKAVQKIWPLLGFRLKDGLSNDNSSI